MYDIETFRKYLPPSCFAACDHHLPPRVGGWRISVGVKVRVEWRWRCEGARRSERAGWRAIQRRQANRGLSKPVVRPLTTDSFFYSMITPNAVRTCQVRFGIFELTTRNGRHIPDRVVVSTILELHSPKRVDELHWLTHFEYLLENLPLFVPRKFPRQGIIRSEKIPQAGGGRGVSRSTVSTPTAMCSKRLYQQLYQRLSVSIHARRLKSSIPRTVFLLKNLGPTIYAAVSSFYRLFTGHSKPRGSGRVGAGAGSGQGDLARF